MLQRHMLEAIHYPAQKHTVVQKLHIAQTPHFIHKLPLLLLLMVVMVVSFDSSGLAFSTVKKHQTPIPTFYPTVSASSHPLMDFPMIVLNHEVFVLWGDSTGGELATNGTSTLI